MKNDVINKFKYFLLYMYFIAGIFGILLSFNSAFGGMYKNYTYFIVLGAATILFLVQIFFKRYTLNVLCISFALLIIFLLNYNEAVYYINNILTGISKTEGLENYEVTYFVIFMGIIAAEFILGIEFETKYTALYFILIMCIVLLNPFMGKKAGSMETALMVISFVGIHTVKGKNKKMTKTRLAVSALFSLAVIVLIGAFFNFSSVYGDILYDAADSVDGYIYREIKNFTGNRGIDYDSGEVGRGNNYQRGTECVEVWLSQKPDEDLYLKGFEGGNYSEGAWAEADEERFFERLAFERGWTRWGNLIGTMYKEIYYNANSSSNPQGIRNARTVTINPLLKNVKNRYYPYIGRWERLTKKDNIAYVYSYYELKDLNINKANMDLDTLNRFEDVKENYGPFVYENYLSVPIDSVPDLYELCKEQNFSNLSEITEFIKSELSKRASYTLTPGMAPSNEDIIEYFLFERKKGYCVHFASAATLMYRSFGVPARYVTGYKINKNDFRETEDGSYYAMALDRNAHAWTEIYLDDKGWIPIEVTPAAVNSADVSFNRNEANENERVTEETSTAVEGENNAVENNVGNEKGYMKTVILCIVVILSALFARRCIIIKRMRKYSVDNIFKNFLYILRLKGIRCTGLEYDFDGIITKAFSVLEAEEAQKFIDIVLKESYGENGCNKEERNFVYDTYVKCAGELYRNSNIFIKFYIKFIRILL